MYMVCNWNSQIDLVRDGMDIADISASAGDSQGSLPLEKSGNQPPDLRGFLFAYHIHELSQPNVHKRSKNQRDSTQVLNFQCTWTHMLNFQGGPGVCLPPVLLP